MREMALTRKRSTTLNRTIVNVGTDWTRLLEDEELLDLELIISNIQNTGSWEIELANDVGEKLALGYDNNTQLVYVDRSQAGNSDFYEGFAMRHEAPRISRDRQMPIRVIVDRSSVEFFADLGEVVLTDLVFPSEPYNKLAFKAPDGPVLAEGVVYYLKSVW